MEFKLSAAEIKTLEEPQTEQVKLALSLFLKELILLGWVNTRRGKRPINPAFWVILVIALGAFGIHFMLGIILTVFVGLYLLSVLLPQTMLFVSDAGEQRLPIKRTETHALLRILKTVADARPHNMDHCTSKEWRTHLGLYYPDNASFHKDFLIAGLVQKGLLKYDSNNLPKRTQAGDEALYQANTAIRKGNDLPRMLRENSPGAAAMAAQLSGLVLLIPGIEGYFGHLFQNVGYLESDLDDLRQKTDHSYGGTTDSGGESSSKQEEGASDTENIPENGSDWQSDADFLDGIEGDTSDTGVGSDAGDGGGDGGDGGDGGGCSGCGGCGGGGD